MIGNVPPVFRYITVVALLAVLLQYTGLSSRLFSAELLPSWPVKGGTGGGSRTVNAARLLADLNSDLGDTAQDGQGHGAANGDGVNSGGSTPAANGVDGGGSGAGDKTPAARAAAAALSILYLAAVPGLREQVTGAPGIVEALLRHASRMDLAALRRDLLEQPQHNHQPQQPQHHHQAAELLAASVLSLAKLAAGDSTLQAWLLGAPGARPRAGQSASLPEGALLARVEELLLRSGVPAWQAAGSVLLHSLSGDPPGRSPSVATWVLAREEELVQMAVGLMETGAHYNNPDVALSASQLLELIASSGASGLRRLLASKAPSLAMQLVVTQAGLNTTSSSSLAAGAARLLTRLLATATGLRSGTGGEAGAPGPEDLARDLVVKGLVAPLVREVRVGQRASLGPSLALLAELLVADASSSGASTAAAAGRQEQQQQRAEIQPADAAAAAAVGSGILSVCSQLLFKVDVEGVDSEPRLHCSAIVRHLRGVALATTSETNRASAGAGGDRSGTGGSGVSELDGLDEPEGLGEGSAANGRSPVEAARSAAAAEGQHALAYTASEAGRASLASDLLAMMSSTPHPDLHNAVVEALRDAAPSRHAAEALVRAGAGPQLVALLSHNTTAEAERGTDPADVAWLLQTQRSAAAVLALLALQGGPLRERLAAEGAVGALAAALATRAGPPGLILQVRVTAAAALVPMLAPDGRHDRVALAAGVLEPLADMLRRGGPQERQAAGRVLELLARDAAVADMYDKAGIKLP